MRNDHAGVLALALLVGTAARAQQPTPAPVPAITPASEHVVAPSLPDQPNKEGVVRPSGSMPMDAAGYVRTNQGPIDPTAPTPVPPSAAAASGAPGASAAPAAPYAGPKGPAVVKAAYLSVAGTVTAFRKGASVTILEKSGLRRHLKLGENASVYDGLAVGDKVVARVPLGKTVDAWTADLVERQKAAQAPVKSKFEKAESPSR